MALVAVDKTIWILCKPDNYICTQLVKEMRNYDLFMDSCLARYTMMHHGTVRTIRFGQLYGCLGY